MNCLICNQKIEYSRCDNCGFELDAPVFCCVHNYDEVSIQNIQHRYTEVINEFHNPAKETIEDEKILIAELKDQIRVLNEKLEYLENKHLNAIGCSSDHHPVLENILQEAESGNSEAQYKLGSMYAGGDGVKKDYIEAIIWFRLSASQGNSKAQNSLGLMYQSGHGVKKQYEEAVKWFQLSAWQGNCKAQYNLGQMYEMGCGVQPDYNEAIKWYQLAADQGDKMALNALGDIYRLGTCVNEDYEKAVEFYLRSADQGYKKASYNLEKMIRKYQNIAKKGNSEAQYNLGYMYEKGFGVLMDKKVAMEWYQLAAEQGNVKAQEKLNIR